MTDDAAAFIGCVPATYHQRLGPILFEPYAQILAERVAELAPPRLLETACGTGIVTREIAGRLPAAERFVATDLNHDMLDLARQHAVAPGLDFQTADMCALPFADGDFDCVVCQFGLMFPPDRAAATREVRRVLAPGGTWLVATWSRMERNPLIDATHGELVRMFPDDPPPFYLTPYSLCDPDELAAMLRVAGFREISVEIVAATGTSPSADVAAEGLVRGNPVAAQIEARQPGRVDEATAAVRGAIAARFGDGPLEVPLEALVATAVA